MSEKPYVFATPAVKSRITSRRPSTVASTARKAPPPSAPKKFVHPRPRVNQNATISSDADMTLLNFSTTAAPDFEAEYNQVAYGKFLRTMLEEVTAEEKCTREETIMDIQMAQLAARFQKTVEQLDKTNKRLKDIKFTVEQKRLMDLKSNDCTQFYKATDETDVADQLVNLSTAEDACLDRLATKNVDFGYNKDSGHKQLLDAVNDALEGLEMIKKQSNLDVKTFENYKETEKTLTDLDKNRFDLESLKCEFEKKFPSFGEKLIKQVSEKINSIMNDDQGNDGDGDDEDIEDSD